MLQITNGDSSEVELKNSVPIIDIPDQKEDVCENVLEGKMISTELNGTADPCSKTILNYDGSDSGLDIATTVSLRLQRALSSNSGDYASSSGGIDVESNVNDNLSCGSSMISCTSDLCSEHKTVSTVPHQKANYECCSENGSESSSVAVGCKIRKTNNVKKKVGVFDPNSNKSVWKMSDGNQQSTQLNKMRSRVSNTSHTKTENFSLQIRERARSREKAEKPLSNSSSKNGTPPFRSTPVRRTPKPDSLPSALNSTVCLQRGSYRTPSMTRARTPGTPSDDGRWPSIGGRGASVGIGPKRGTSVTPELGSLKIRGQIMSFDSKCLNSSGISSNTLPRRRKQKSVEDLRGRASRSSSNSRDNGMVSSITVTTRNNMGPAFFTPKTFTPPNKVTNRKTTSKTRIYHEMGIQTVMIGHDIQRAFDGKTCRCVQIDSAEFAEKQTQSDIRDIEIERLRGEIQSLISKQSELSNKLDEKTIKVQTMEQQIIKEREEKISIQRELNQNTERVIGMLEFTRQSQPEEGSCDSLMMLESQIQMSGHELVEKQHEIIKLRKLCRTLQAEMERVLVSQECLMQEKICMEREAVELQDFLQHEKTAMCDALNESELEYKHCKKMLSEKEEEIKVLRDECRHLVRLNEQRRQENKLMQSKYSLLESKIKDLKLNQNTAVNGASMALSGLHARLDNLVEQLISSYNISEQDLEDFAYHNEAYPNSISSCNVTPEYENNADVGHTDQTDGSLSPQRNQSFIAAVISAIRNATVPTGKKFRSFSSKQSEAANGDESDSTEMLDSETEPCLMMDNVLEDVTMPDSHSHNMVSSTGIAISQIELPPDLVHAGDDSLHNLSQAITNRQQAELQITSTALNVVCQLGKNVENSLVDEISFHESVAEMPSIVDYCSTQALVDQVIEVDNLITKLLKVLRLIQMDNDLCIQQLIVDKNKLQQNKEDMLEKLKDLQDMNNKLQDELMDATQELMMKTADLTTSKADIQRHRNEIDRLNEDICQLSTLCSQNNSQCNSLEQEETTDGILRMLKNWNQNGRFEEADLKGYLESVCIEPRETLKIQRNFLSVSYEKPIHEIRRQCELINNALNVLNKLENIVRENPLLLQLQLDLEKVNVESNKTLSFYSSSSQEDINANDSSVTLAKISCEDSTNQTPD
ncbi:myosin-2 heavy chain isoform X2 [Eupeodes corollae]|nr:myosin-2 heavy chain isoform X2 [Eupeodes corollae]